MRGIIPYDPLNTPKPFAERVWIVDGPEIRMDVGPFKAPFPTRMTVVRLLSGDLWIHSPIAPDAALFERIEALGQVRHLVAPNSLHYWYMVDWLERYPQATSHAVAGLERAKRPFRIDRRLAPGEGAAAWSDEIACVVMRGALVDEAVFFVRHARVCVLTDLIENFEHDRVRSAAMRWLVRLGGADGSTPLDMRASYLLRRTNARRAAREILGWPVEKVVMAHGRPFERDGAAELRRALRWAA